MVTKLKVHSPRLRNKMVGRASTVRSTNKWKRFSKDLRTRFPFCQYPGCMELTDSVHHIHPLEQRPDLAFEPSNTIPLCNDHHEDVERLTNWGTIPHSKFADWRKKYASREEAKKES